MSHSPVKSRHRSSVCATQSDFTPVLPGSGLLSSRRNYVGSTDAAATPDRSLPSEANAEARKRLIVALAGTLLAGVPALV